VSVRFHKSNIGKSSSADSCIMVPIGHVLGITNIMVPKGHVLRITGIMVPKGHVLKYYRHYGAKRACSEDYRMSSDRNTQFP